MIRNKNETTNGRDHFWRRNIESVTRSLLSAWYYSSHILHHFYCRRPHLSTFWCRRVAAISEQIFQRNLVQKITVLSSLFLSSPVARRRKLPGRNAASAHSNCLLCKNSPMLPYHLYRTPAVYSWFIPAATHPRQTDFLRFSTVFENYRTRQLTDSRRSNTARRIIGFFSIPLRTRECLRYFIHNYRTRQTHGCDRQSILVRVGTSTVNHSCLPDHLQYFVFTVRIETTSRNKNVAYASKRYRAGQ